MVGSSGQGRAIPDHHPYAKAFALSSHSLSHTNGERPAHISTLDTDFYSDTAALIRGWMPILRNPEDARFNDVLIVEAQRDDRGPTCRCQTDHMGSAIFPAKMRPPKLGAGIEKRDERLVEGVTGVSASAFEFIATIARCAKIFQRVAAARGAGCDVINNQRHCDQTASRATILATFAGPDKDLLAQGGG